MDLPDTARPHRLRKKDRRMKQLKWTWALLASLMLCSFTWAQKPGPIGLPGLELGTGPNLLDGPPVEWKATFQAQKGSDQATIRITAKLLNDFYIYSVTQPPGGPLKTKFSFPDKDADLVGDWQPDRPPKQVKGEPGFEQILVEKHFDEVTWTGSIRLKSAPADPPKPIKIRAVGQVCSDTCIPFTEVLEASFAGWEESTQPAASETSVQFPWRDPEAHVSWNLRWEPGTDAQSGSLVIEGIPDDQYHLYPSGEGEEETNFRTLMILDPKSSLVPRGPPKTDALLAVQEIPGSDPVPYHQGNVTWRVPMKLLEASQQSKGSLEGWIGYQACTLESCDQPLGAKFQGQWTLTESGQIELNQWSILPVPFKEVAGSPLRNRWLATSPEGRSATDSSTSATLSSSGSQFQSTPVLSAADLLLNLGLAFLGGLVLNFMPCVLPVIGLKIMGIVQESQGSRRRVAWLNFWYVLGILSVVIGLGLATVIAKELFSATFMWGEQFSSWGFRIGMLVLVFAMALSFLGVWEIPIPGFASGGASNKWMAQEGPIGAFSKGALTTVLATPCIGPFLGTALGVALSQPSWIVLLIFLFIGLGLSSPYILIAAVPRLMSWLPKPGPWMDTFKQLLAFPLLFTCIFLLSSISDDYRIATLTMLIGVWFACWWIGKVPAWAERSKYWITLALATGVASGLGVWSFRALGPVDKNDAHAISWVPYSEGELQKLLKQRKTVMIDFTADWCANCKTNLKTAIETEKVAKKIRDNRVVAMVADWTDFGPEIKQKLIELQSNGIPLLAIYPGTRPTEPILLRALLFESNVLGALEEAGPSQ